MTDKQPLALRLADALEEKDFPPRRAAATELRRLHEVNAELVEALIDMVEAAKKSNGAKSFTELGAIGQACAAIAKATGENNG